MDDRHNLTMSEAPTMTAEAIEAVNTPALFVVSAPKTVNELSATVTAPTAKVLPSSSVNPVLVKLTTSPAVMPVTDATSTTVGDALVMSVGVTVVAVDEPTCKYTSTPFVLMIAM